jgi:hypothetical protein
MPVVVTGDQILAQVAKLDADTKELDDVFAALGAAVPDATRVGWRDWYGTPGESQGPPPSFAPVPASGYQGWSAYARAHAGDWFVASLGDQAAAYAMTIQGWQAIANLLAQGKPAPAIPVDATSNEAGNANLGIPGLNAPGAPSSSSLLLIGAVVALALVVAVKR